MATLTAVPTTDTDESAENETFKRLVDENVGSFYIEAPFEAWQEVLESMRNDGNPTIEGYGDDTAKLLRGANDSPGPGVIIGIEIMPGTDSDAHVDAICERMPLDQEDGSYTRKPAKTVRKTAKLQANAGGDPTKMSKKAAKTTPRPCRCGCGETTGGGTFRPGHDARFKGQLLKRIDAGGEDGEAALAELKEFPKLTDYDAAVARFGSGPAKEAAKKERLAELKAKKEAEAAAAQNAGNGPDDESEDDSEDEESEE